MPNSKWVQVNVPLESERGLIWTTEEEFQKYLSLLNTSIFPTIDKLNEMQLISNYHFLHYSPPLRLELRLLVNNEKELDNIQTIMKKNLPTGKLEDYNVKNGESQNTLDILRLQTEIIRITINQTKFSKEEGGMKRFYDQITHYPNNAIGMNMPEERDFCIAQALKWQAEIGYQQGIQMENQQAKQKEKQQTKNYFERMNQVKAESPLAYTPWNNIQEQKLRELFSQGKTIKEISKELQRQPGGIRARLKRLNLIQ